jgi:hypothetical protein
MTTTMMMMMMIIIIIIIIIILIIQFNSVLFIEVLNQQPGGQWQKQA